MSGAFSRRYVKDVLANVLHALQHIGRIRIVATGISWIHQLKCKSASEITDDLPLAIKAFDRMLEWF